jgi:hypothetical protein
LSRHATMPDTKDVLLQLAQTWNTSLESQRMEITFIPYDKEADPTSQSFRDYASIAKYIADSYTNGKTLKATDNPSQTNVTWQYANSLSQKNNVTSFLLFAPKLTDYTASQDAVTDMSNAGKNLKTISQKAKTGVACSGLNSTEIENYGNLPSVNVYPNASSDINQIAGTFSPPAIGTTQPPTTTTTVPTVEPACPASPKTANGDCQVCDKATATCSTPTVEPACPASPITANGDCKCSDGTTTATCTKGQVCDKATATCSVPTNVPTCPASPIRANGVCTCSDGTTIATCNKGQVCDKATATCSVPRSPTGGGGPGELCYE